jgi:hypothetical protein
MMPSLPDPGSPEAPKYWRYETGGLLAIAVENYLNHRAMTVRDVAMMRAYLCQWIDSPAWDMNPGNELAALRKQAAEILTVEDIHRWIHAALGLGIDPL